jgi:hypothetical protein
MIKLEIEPHDKQRGKVIKINVNNYWYRSAMGFGSYTQCISSSTFKRIAGNSKLYYTNDPDGNRYKVKAQRLGVGYYLVIKPVEKVKLQ